MIIVEYKLENYCINELKDMYEKSHIVFGLKPNIFSKNKFLHLYNKKIYRNASDNYSKFINIEFIKYYKKTRNPLLILLDYFEPHISKSIFVLFLIKEIKKKYSNEKIILFTSDKKLKFLYDNKIIDVSNLDIKLLYFPIKWQNKKFNFSSVISLIGSNYKNKLIYYYIFNYIYLFYFILKVVLFKIKFGENNSKSIDNRILFVSNSFSHWDISIIKKFFMDRYYSKVLYKLKIDASMKNKIRVITIDFTTNNKLVKYSIYNYIKLNNILSLIPQVLTYFHEISKISNNFYKISESSLLVKIFNMFIIKKILLNQKPKAIIYYDEVYWSGKMLSVISNSLNIDSYGFQHAFDSYHHITYKTLRISKEVKEVFPKYFFVYGPYSKKLFSSYGYPKDKIIEIGFDRIENINYLKPIIRDKLNKKKVLFLSINSTIYVLLEELIKKKDFLNIISIACRPHPLTSINKEKFMSKYPEILLINPKKSSLDKNINTVDCVIGNSSTSLINAIYQKKIVISFQPFGVEDFYDLKYWGAQVINNINEINLNIENTTNSVNVLKEITLKNDIVFILKNKYFK